MPNETHPYMRTVSGRDLVIAEPSPTNIDIVDIAHALSMTCRYGGHVKRFYSVAQHSVLVSRLCAKEDALWGLMHDAAEAYVGDVISPVKKYFRDFNRVEAYFMDAICKKFEMKSGMPASVARADLDAYFLEEHWLRGNNYWPNGTIPPWCFTQKIKPQSQLASKEAFLERFKELTK